MTAIVLPFQPDAMTPAQLAAVSYLARYSGATLGCRRTSCAAGSPGARQTDWTRWSVCSGLNRPGLLGGS